MLFNVLKFRLNVYFLWLNMYSDFLHFLGMLSNKYIEYIEIFVKRNVNCMLFIYSLYLAM